jgi:hypothetical protein
MDFDAVFAPCEHERAAFEAEEQAGMRRLDIEDRDLGESAPGVTLEAFCTAVKSKAGVSTVGMAIQPFLTPTQRRARELEAHGYYRCSVETLRRIFKSQRHNIHSGVFLMRTERAWKTPRLSVRALAAVVKEMEPEWVAAVAEARRFADDARIIAGWCELPLQAVLGCLWVLDAEPSAA